MDQDGFGVLLCPLRLLSGDQGCVQQQTNWKTLGGKPLLQESTELTQGQRRLSQNVSVCSALIPGLTILSVRYALLHNDPIILCLISFIKQLTVLNRETLS